MAKRKVQSQINLERLAGGAFAEKLNEALMQVAENIQNPNTEATTKRQINIAIKFAPNKSRQVINTQISVTTKLAATEAIDNVKSYLVEALADIPNREQITIIA